MDREQLKTEQSETIVSGKMPADMKLPEKELLESRLDLVRKNLYNYLFGLDQKYIDNLIRLGRTETDAKRLAAWDWTHGIGLYGMYKQYENTKDEKILDEIESWYDDRLKIGLPDKNVNTVAPLLTMACLYTHRPKEQYRQIMEEWSYWIMTDMKRTKEGGIQHEHAELENAQELWDDTLFMTVLFLAKYGIMTQRTSYVEEAKYQFLLHAKYLCDQKTGLWYHGWSFIERSNFAGALWGRGNCWITVFIPDFLEIVDLKEAEKRIYIGYLADQAEALAACQEKNGMWHTLLNDPESYVEASATAGFTYGILKGVRKGYLGKELSVAGLRGLKAVIENIDSEGSLTNVSYGTNVGRTLEHYRKIPLARMHYGQALALLALIEGSRIQD